MAHNNSTNERGICWAATIEVKEVYEWNPMEGITDDKKKYIKGIQGQLWSETITKKEFFDTAVILISEWANGGDLLDFLRRNYKKLDLLHWKVIIFQILFTLAVIQKKYPGFRHNDLKANNILLQVFPKPKTKQRSQGMRQLTPAHRRT